MYQMYYLSLLVLDCDIRPSSSLLLPHIVLEVPAHLHMFIL